MARRRRERKAGGLGLDSPLWEEIESDTPPVTQGELCRGTQCDEFKKPGATVNTSRFSRDMGNCFYSGKKVAAGNSICPKEDKTRQLPS